MRNTIREKIERLRQAWEPSLECYLAGRIPGPSVAPKAGAPQCYNEFLQVTNGPVCGCVVFHKYEEYDKSQFIVENLPGGAKHWACIGSLKDDPLFIRRRDDVVVVADRYEFKQREYEDFDDFLEKWIFGPSYLELRGEVDDWFKFMKQVGIV